MPSAFKQILTDKTPTPMTQVINNLIKYTKAINTNLMPDFFSSIAPPEIQVACFIGADNLQEVLGDLTKEIKWDNTNEVVKKCAKLADAKDYKLFALGQNGRCLSGPDTSNRYHISGTYGAYCKDGIGMGNSMFVYALGKYSVGRFYKGAFFFIELASKIKLALKENSVQKMCLNNKKLKK